MLGYHTHAAILSQVGEIQLLARMQLRWQARLERVANQPRHVRRRDRVRRCDALLNSSSISLTKNSFAFRQRRGSAMVDSSQRSNVPHQRDRQSSQHNWLPQRLQLRLDSPDRYRTMRRA